MKTKYAKNIYTASFKAEALAYIANGASITETAQAFNTSRPSIRHWCRQAEMPIRSRALTVRQKSICQEYTESELSLRETAQKYNVPFGTLRGWLSKYRNSDANIISTTNKDRADNYAVVRPTTPEVRQKTVAAVYNNIDNQGQIYGLKTSKRWLELPKKGE